MTSLTKRAMAMLQPHEQDSVKKLWRVEKQLAAKDRERKKQRYLTKKMLSLECQ
ncbi:MAG: hypothetical protein LBC12_01830 [Nitrososphaerota archaeon]|jgi:hypothetical protein|nr:hypothetical protein [Nitrososphaerota archaeon]